MCSVVTRVRGGRRTGAPTIEDRPRACVDPLVEPHVCASCNSRTRCVVFCQDQSLSLRPDAARPTRSVQARKRPQTEGDALGGGPTKVFRPMLGGDVRAMRTGVLSRPRTVSVTLACGCQTYNYFMHLGALKLQRAAQVVLRLPIASPVPPPYTHVARTRHCLHGRSWFSNSEQRCSRAPRNCRSAPPLAAFGAVLKQRSVTSW